MGSKISRSKAPGADRRVSGVLKRKIPKDENEDPVPTKRVRIPETGEFIISRLFKGGEGSNITVKSLGREWKLHRIYLEQSPFFQALFSGGWKDSELNVVELQVVDKKITESGLDIALSSMYREGITIPYGDVVSVAAAARMLQLEGLVQKCGEIMEESITNDTVVDYLDAVEDYGILNIKNELLDWLAYNVTPISNLDMLRTFKLIRRLSIPNMEILVRHEDLLVFPCELILYSIVASWIYMRERNVFLDDLSDPNKILADAREYFSSRIGPVFVATKKGQQYAAVIKNLRFKELLTHETDMDILQRDKMVSETTLEKASRILWRRQVHLGMSRLSLLGGDVTVESNGCFGDPQFSTWDLSNPNSEPWYTMDTEAFYKESFRYGKYLENPAVLWRWKSYMFGVRVSMRSTNSGVEMIFQDTVKTDSGMGANGTMMRDSRFLAYRIRLFNVVDNQRKLSFDTGIRAEEVFETPRRLFLKNESRYAFPLPVMYPMVLSAHILICRKEELTECLPVAVYDRAEFYS